MSSEQLITFNDLINSTFDNGTLHVNNLQVIFKILVAQLKLGDVKVDYGDHNKTSGPVQVEQNSDNVVKVNRNENTLLEKQTGRESVESLNENEEKISKSLIDLSEKIDSKASEIARVEEFVNIESSKSSSNHSAGSKKSNMSIKSIHVPKSSATIKSDAPKDTQHSFLTEELKTLINQQINAAGSLISKKLSKIEKSVCGLQKTAMSHQETIDDLLFACESIDMKHVETVGEIKDFNSKILCLKRDVRTLIEDSTQFKSELEEVNTKYEIIDEVKTNKTYVDELWRQKAFKSDLEFFVRRDEFDPLVDVLQLKFSLLTEHFDKLDGKTKKSLACMKSEIDEKLDVQS